MFLRDPKTRKKDILAAVGFLAVLLLVGFSAKAAWKFYKETPPYIDHQKYPISGIDVSRHQGMMNLDATVAAGYDFIFIKASEGETVKDTNFRLNYEKATHAGLKTGAYHYFRFDVDGVNQARNLLDVIGDRSLDLGVAIDVEEHGNARGVDKEVICERLTNMVEYLYLKGLRPIIYTNTRGYDDFIAETLPGCVLWICGFTDPPISADWTFWQYNHRGKVPGIKGPVDLDVFSGDREQWEVFLSEQRYDPSEVGTRFNAVYLSPKD